MVTLFLDIGVTMDIARGKGFILMGQIHMVHTAEAVGAGVDYDVIQTLKNAIGAERYEQIAEDATFKLADRLGRLDRALRDADLPLCYRHALNILGVSSQIGLTSVATVAKDVMICTNEGNVEALPAVISRLNRLAEASLFAVFDV